jgi:hypothetical protein
MTALQQRMIEDMQLHGFAERTQKSYMQAVRQLAVANAWRLCATGL